VSFTWPTVLAGLAAVPAILLSLVIAGRRQRAARARLADSHLYAQVAGPADRRQRVPVAFYLGGLAVLLVGGARPVASIPLPVNRASLILAIDTSQSMMGEDVKPSRLDAAKLAAVTVLRHVPASLPVGLVTFSDTGTIVVNPTTDRRRIMEALDGLKLQQSTAVGSGVLEGLQALPGRREFLGERLMRLRAQSDPYSSPFGPPAPPNMGQKPVTADDLTPAAIVLFSDGVENTGADLRQAAQLAAEGRVRVYTVAIGRDGGSVMPFGGGTVLVPFDPSGLQTLAQQTGGEFLRALDDAGARRIGRQLGRAIGWERRRTELAGLFAGVGGLLIAGGALASLAWFRRVP
jgi:Ca-activated chloride channel family protein